MISLRPFLAPMLAATLSLPANLSAQNVLPQQQRQQDIRSGEQLFVRLMRMSPEDRERALANLPPARRTRIETRIHNFQLLPPIQQERRLERLEKLNSLPPDEQDQVRRAMQDLARLPQDRKQAVNREMQLLTRMTDEQRYAHLTSEAFHSRFSPGEQQMIGKMAEILPARELQATPPVAR